MLPGETLRGRIVARFLSSATKSEIDLKRNLNPNAQVDPCCIVPRAGPLHFQPTTPRVHGDPSQESAVIPSKDHDDVKVGLDVFVFPSRSHQDQGVSMATTTNLTRSADECTANCLKRIGLNLAKRQKSRTKKTRTEHPTAPIHRAFTVTDDGDPNDIDTSSLSNIDFWSHGISQPLTIELSINGTTIELYVEINPPTIAGVATFEKFEACLFPGVPIHIQVDTLFASTSTVDWYADKQQVCQNSPLYIPTVEDGGKMLTVLITPIRPDHDGQGCQEAYEFINPVAVSRPTHAVLQIRPHWQHARTNADSSLLRVISYNILADQNAFSGPGRSCFFPWCPAEIVDRKRRMPLIVHEILAYQADVICLQEVDQVVFDTLLDPLLRYHNYQGFFSVKQTSGNQEGCAMFWSLNKFQRAIPEHIKTFRLSELLSQYREGIPDNLDWHTCANVLTEIFRKRPDLYDVVQTRLGHVVQMAHLQNHDGLPLLISNTHLFYHPNAPHIRLMQLFAIAHQLVIEQEQTSSGSTKPFILCGDFNTSLKNAALLLMDRHVPKNHRDYRKCFNSFEWSADRTKKEDPCEVTSDYDFPEMNLPDSFPDLVTAYPDYPDFTHYVVGFSATLDHILMTSKADIGALSFHRQAEMPTLEQVTQDQAMPSASFPSDHIAVLADLRWIN